jgi:hypothetical protein
MLKPPSKSSTSDVTKPSDHATTLQQRRPVHSPSADTSGDSKSEKTSLSARQQQADLDNPPLAKNTELYLKLGMALFVLVAYKIMSYLMLEEGEGLDRAGSRLSKFLGHE